MEGLNPNFSDGKAVNGLVSWKKWGIVAGAVVFCVLLFLAWTLWLSPEAKEFKADRANYELAINAISTYENAMKNDTYGGNTTIF